jgi:hypothetical protein
MSSKRLEQMADELADETLHEAAETFFGRRKQLDEAKERLQRRVEELARLRATVLDRAATLFHLLGRDNAPGLFAALGVEPGPLLAEALPLPPLGPKAREWVMPKTWSWTNEGEYEKLALTAYAAVWDRLDEFLHGRVYTDAKTGRKHISVSLEWVLGECARLNAAIIAQNANHPASAAISFFKGLDPVAQDQERLTDAPVDGFAQDLDASMALTAVDCAPLAAMALPVLPRPEDAREAVTGYCDALFASQGEELRRIVAQW